MKPIVFFALFGLLLIESPTLKVTEQTFEIMSIAEAKFHFIGFLLDQLVAKKELFEI